MKSKPAWAILRDGKIVGVRMSRSYATELLSYFSGQKGGKKYKWSVARAKITVR